MGEKSFDAEKDYNAWLLPMLGILNRPGIPGATISERLEFYVKVYTK